MKFSAKQLESRYRVADEARQPWISKWQEIYDLCLPGRRGFYSRTAGSNTGDDIFDDTGAVSIQAFASVMKEGITPSIGNIINWVPGRNVPFNLRARLQDELYDLTEYFHQLLRATNFEEAIDESYIDLSIGTATLCVYPTNDSQYMRFEALPLEAYAIDRGPGGLQDGTFRRRKVSLRDIKYLWPNASISAEMSAEGLANPDAIFDVLEFEVRQWDEPGEKYHRGVLWCKHNHFLVDLEPTGRGSRQKHTFTWSRSAGETWGRGPALQALPSIRTTNLEVELILENADMQVMGIWKSDTEGMPNFDNTSIEPGTVYPYMAGTRGLESVQAAGSLTFADMLLRDQRANIREAMLNEDFAGKGDTPISAAEVDARMLKLSTKIGRNVGRIYSEGLFPLVHSAARILMDAGALEMPEINGESVDMLPASPLALSYRQLQIQRLDAWTQRILGAMGEAAATKLNGDELIKEYGSLLGVPVDRFLLDPMQQAQAIGVINQMQGVNGAAAAAVS